MHIITDLSWPFAVLCLLLGVAYSFVLYFMGRRKSTFPTTVQWMLGVLRCLSVSLIAFLLLAPLSKRTRGEHEKPIIVVAQDNSQSILLGGDSAYYKGEYAEAMNKLIDQLSNDYDVQCYNYGAEVEQNNQPDYTHQATNMADLVSEINQRMDGRNVGAMILTGDGIYNQGANPLGVVSAAFPIYTVALGDTTIRRDAAVAHVRYNKIAYLDNQFPIEVIVNAAQMSGEQATLTLSHKGKVLASKQIHYSSNDASVTETFMIDANEPGLQTYTLSISPCKDEASLKNNTRTVIVEVIDGRQRIGIIAAAPHPDIAALRSSIANNKNYQVEVMMADDVKGNLADYDLVILHQLPSKSGGMPIVENAVKNHIPILFILGSQTDMARFNSLHLGMEIFSKIDRTSESTPLFNSNFSLFDLDQEVARQMELFPPLAAPFGEYRSAANTQSLFTAKVGSMNSGQPLLAFSQQGDVRYGFVAGEGLWRWRMADYQEHNNHNIFNTLVSKMIVYTSMRINKDRFHVEAQQLYQESQAVVIEAQLYNANYELTNQPEVQFTLQPAEGEKANYAFSRNGNSYSLNLGRLTPGTYRYYATTQQEGKALSASGSFIVEALQLEDLNLVADHALMNTLANNTGGTMLMPNEIDKLPKLLKERDDIKTVVYSNIRYTEWINLPLLLALLILLMGAEWVLRKYHGEI